MIVGQSPVRINNRAAVEDRAAASRPVHLLITQHNDNARTGVYSQETAIDWKSVTVESGFGRLGDFVVEGDIAGQPLTASSDGKNLVIVATSHNLIYAFDADKPGSSWVWRYDAGSANSIGACNSVQIPIVKANARELGIVSTPVIEWHTGTLYAVALTRRGSTFVHAIHAVNIKDGKPKAPPSEIPKGVFKYNTERYLSRAALLLSNGNLYVSFAGRWEDDGNFGGLLLHYSSMEAIQQGLPPLQFLHSWMPAPTKAGIWQSGGGPAADDAGNIFLTTGDGKNDDGNAGQEFDQSDIKLSRDLTLLDWFTPSFRGYLNGKVDKHNDLDLGITGPVLLPNRQLAHGSKQGIVYVLSANNLGHFSQYGNPQIVQVPVFDFLPEGTYQMDNRHIHTTPVSWFCNPSSGTNCLYVASDAGHGVAVLRYHDVITANAEVTIVRVPNDPQITQMSLSSNGYRDGTGILWFVGCIGCTDTQRNFGTLYAYNAVTMQLLYTSQQIPQRDGFPLDVDYPRFNAPTISNGKVFVPTFSHQESQTCPADRHVLKGALARLIVYGPRQPPRLPPPTAPQNCRPFDLCGNGVDFHCDMISEIVVLKRLDGGIFRDVKTDSDASRAHIPFIYDYPGTIDAATYQVCSQRENSEACTTSIPVTLTHSSCSAGGGGGGGVVPPRECGHEGQPKCGPIRFQ